MWWVTLMIETFYKCNTSIRIILYTQDFLRMCQYYKNHQFRFTLTHWIHFWHVRCSHEVMIYRESSSLVGPDRVKGPMGRETLKPIKTKGKGTCRLSSSSLGRQRIHSYRQLPSHFASSPFTPPPYYLSGSPILDLGPNPWRNGTRQPDHFVNSSKSLAKVWSLLMISARALVESSALLHLSGYVCAEDDDRLTRKFID